MFNSFFVFFPIPSFPFFFGADFSNSSNTLLTKSNAIFVLVPVQVNITVVALSMDIIFVEIERKATNGCLLEVSSVIIFPFQSSPRASEATTPIPFFDPRGEDFPEFLFVPRERLLFCPFHSLILPCLDMGLQQGILAFYDRIDFLFNTLHVVLHPAHLFLHGMEDVQGFRFVRGQRRIISN